MYALLILFGSRTIEALRITVCDVTFAINLQILANY